MPVVTALMVMVLVLALGGGLALDTAIETRIAASYSRSQQALYAAEAAAERALVDLAGVVDWNPVLAGAMPSTFVDGPFGGVRTLIDGSTIDLTQVVNLANCDKKTLCTGADMNAVTERRPWGPNNPRWQPYAFGPVKDLLPAGGIVAPIYVVAMVADDPGENDGDPSSDGGDDPDNPGSGVVAVRAEAFGPWNTHRILELTVRAPGARVTSWRVVR